PAARVGGGPVGRRPPHLPGRALLPRRARRPRPQPGLAGGLLAAAQPAAGRPADGPQAGLQTAGPGGDRLAGPPGRGRAGAERLAGWRGRPRPRPPRGAGPVRPARRRPRGRGPEDRSPAGRRARGSLACSAAYVGPPEPRLDLEGPPPPPLRAP